MAAQQTASRAHLRSKQHLQSVPSLHGIVTNYHRMIGTEMVGLYVGPNKEHYHVHKKILCNEIPYFEKMFKGNFKEATSQSA